MVEELPFLSSGSLVILELLAKEILLFKNNEIPMELNLTFCKSTVQLCL